MAYTDIDKPTDYFNTKLYTGNGSTNAITGVGFQPDLLWIRNRLNSSRTARAIDSVRGVGKLLNIAGSADEDTQADTVTSFDSDGFSLGADSSEYGVNDNTGSHVAWSWKAGGTASSNTDGSITSSVSASTTSGFSIVSFTGTGNALTAGHGLGVKPSMIIAKSTTIANNWIVQHGSLGATNTIFLDNTNPSQTGTVFWNDTEPTSSVFSLGNWSGINTSGSGIIAYCFADTGNKFFKAGSYTGNGQNDNTFIHTGFKPAFIMIKKTDSSDGNDNWVIVDNKRLGYNVDNNPLYPNTSGAEVTSDYIDFLSNGAKIRNGANEVGRSGVVYIYMAFAESPFVTSTGIPTTAR